MTETSVKRAVSNDHNEVDGLDKLVVAMNTSSVSVATQQLTPTAVEPALTNSEKNAGKLAVQLDENVAVVEEQPTASNDEESNNVDLLKMMNKSASKKPVLRSKSKLGAKKLDTTPSDNRFESFDAVAKRKLKTEQEETDRRLAVNLQDQEAANNTEVSGRIVAQLREESSGGSIYRSTQAPAQSNSQSIYRSDSNKVNASTTSGNETYIAREKYSKAKAISSDQFFGLDQEQDSKTLSRLQMYSNSTSISSDMLYREGQRNPSNEYGSNSGLDADGAAISLNKLKDSVSGFFDDLQRRIG